MVSKMMTKTNLTIIAALFFFFFTAYSIAYSQPNNQELTGASEQQDSEELTTISTLKSTTEVIKDLEGQIRRKKAELKTVVTQDQTMKIQEEITTLNERLEPLKINFEEIATGVSLASFEERPQKQFDWKEELQVLVGPLIQELKNITEQPREIERLRSDVAYYEKRVPLVKSALDNINNLFAQTQDEKLKNQLHDLKRSWETREQNVSNQLMIAQYQLNEKLKERTSLLESGQNILRTFFKSRGRNFLFSALAFVFVFFTLRAIHRYVYKTSQTLRSVKRSFYVRIVDITYHIFTFVGATGAMLVVLYSYGDWVLLGIAFILVFGLFWTAKNTLPHFWEQGKLLLNLGSVRENERVVYNGIPWRVISLQIYTYLVNPELKGGVIRFPIKELAGIKSRPFHPDEPWFPCKENDFVLLADNTFGKVVLQTPEVVQLELSGGSQKTYATEEFLKQTPNNLSRGFSLNITCGIDYQYQAISTREVPDMLRKYLYDELNKEGYGENVVNLKVEFKEAGDSSLDYEIIASFTGLIAKDYFVLSRVLQRLSLEACNRYGWEIPFNQITVHTIPAKT